MKSLIQVIASLACAMVLSACGGSTSLPAIATDVTTLSTIDTVLGTGTIAATGSAVTVSAPGWLYNSALPNFQGSQFNPATSFSFTVGAGTVITGFDQGVQGMQVGGTRTLIIPSSLGYGATGNGGAVPPNTGLVFNVTLLSIN